MKSNRVVLVLTTVFIGIGIVIANGRWQPVQAQSFDKTLASRDYATLLKLLPADGKRRFEKIVENGFELSYEMGGKSTSASTTGNKLKRLRREKIELDGRSVVIKEVTKDKALEITTYFFFDEEKQKLTIDRRIRNTSSRTINLKMMREHVDPKLVLGGQSISQRSKLAQTVLDRIRAGYRISEVPDPNNRFGQGGLNAKHSIPKRLDCECPDPPRPCTTIACPPDGNYALARLINPGRKKIILEWRIGASLGQDGTSALPANEARFVTALDLRREPIGVFRK